MRFNSRRRAQQKHAGSQQQPSSQTHPLSPPSLGSLRGGFLAFFFYLCTHFVTPAPSLSFLLSDLPPSPLLTTHTLGFFFFTPPPLFSVSPNCAHTLSPPPPPPSSHSQTPRFLFFFRHTVTKKVQTRFPTAAPLPVRSPISSLLFIFADDHRDFLHFVDPPPPLLHLTALF